MNTLYLTLGTLLLLWLTGNIYRKQKTRNKTIHINKNNCTGCLRCIKRCPRHVLETLKDETGLHATVKHPDKCTACGDCLSKCRFNALKLIDRT